jgi:hypothetical protein
MATEKQTAERKITQWLDTQADVWYFKEHGDRYSKNGVPDIIASVNGQLVGLEAKAGNGHKLSVIQLFQGLKLQASGGLFIVAFPDFSGVDVPKLNLADFNLVLSDFKGVEKPLSLGQAKYMALSKLSKAVIEKGVSTSFE